jgi:hypothetical protein
MTEQETLKVDARMDKILEEIAAYQVDLEDDPTQPHLGTKYLQKVVAQCRSYLNRVTFYHQELSREEKRLKMGLKLSELDLSFKTKEKLADDPEVRKQPSIADREALATTMLRGEHQSVSDFGMELMNVQETLKLVKFKHAELLRTAADIRMQRMLVKDDFEARMGGGEGYVKPQSGQDRAVEGGLPPPVPREAIDPTDLLDPEKRPDDLPEPIDKEHARMIADFFNGPARQPAPAPEPGAVPREPAPEPPAPPMEPAGEKVKSISYDDLLV